MSIKKTITFYQELAKSRNHELISVSNNQTPSQGKVTILCKTCNKEFTTTANSYQNARQTGCIELKVSLLILIVLTAKKQK